MQFSFTITLPIPPAALLLLRSLLELLLTVSCFEIVIPGAALPTFYSLVSLLPGASFQNGNHGPDEDSLLDFLPSMPSPWA